MNDFSRNNKVTGVYWLKKSLEELKIKLTLKSQEGLISLPKYEEYTKESGVLSLENTAQEYIFKWQEKVFSRWELQRYAVVHNCITDTELKYHDIIHNSEQKPSKIFTYTDEDEYLQLGVKEKKPGLMNLEPNLVQLSLSNSIGRVFGGNTVSTQHLFKSNEDIVNEDDKWTSMRIVFDNSDYNEDLQLLLKQEVTVLSLYHNVSHNFLILTPDVNTLELNPYTVETVTGVPCGYQYAVEIEFEDMEDVEELATLLWKLLKKWEKKQKYLLNFATPPLGKKYCYVTFEILTAKDFDMDNIYIEFDIKLPEEVQRTDALHGRTHTSEALSVEDLKEWHFSHVVEFSLEFDAGIEPSHLKVFLEAISTDWWGRHRTEGYYYLPVTLAPGGCTRRLSFSRPEELDTVAAENRRFFVGGCHLIKDLEVLTKPRLQDTSYKFQSTGSLKVRWNMILQDHSPGVSTNTSQPSTSSASALLQGAETALKKYKKARARLAAATRDLSDV